MLELCEAEGYHFGPIMTGQSETTIFSQGESKTHFKSVEDDAIACPVDYGFSIHPLAIDVGLQSQLRRSILQHGQKQLPARVNTLKIYGANSQGTELVATARQLSVAEDKSQALVSFEIKTDSGSFIAELDGWCYITGLAKTDPLSVIADGLSQVRQLSTNSYFALQSLWQNGAGGFNADGIPKQWLLGRPDNLGDDKVIDFVAVRRALLSLLGNPLVSSKLLIPAKKVRLMKDISGAPYLTGRNKNKLSISISMAHSKGFGAAACSFEGSIGIDVETLGTFVPDWTGLSEAEQDLLDAVRKKTGYDKDILSTIVFSLVEAVYKCLASKAVSNGHAAVSRKRRYRLTDITPYGEAKFETEIGKVDCQYLVIGDKVISLARDQTELIHDAHTS
jgi:hypothetical protein